jgi:pimeloyl-ACP methyl ester carboxylesterase
MHPRILPIRVLLASDRGPLGAEGAHRLAVDLPGFGDSAAEPGPYTMEAFADVLAQLLDLKGIAKIALVGGSTGGVVARHFILRQPPANQPSAPRGDWCLHGRSPRRARQDGCDRGVGVGRGDRRDDGQQILSSTTIGERTDGISQHRARSEPRWRRGDQICSDERCGELCCSGAARALRNRTALTAIAAKRSIRLIFIGLPFAHSCQQTQRRL